ncbi:hypothetical protein [Oceanobacillus jeddahense]|uniref:Uncharacterized protein n=1 Tax=Oceanobacillus jeddahense TaxID=1462527 RepID=A0ABY5JRB1_9BACI|nr:hypothetical protein [Oceanobacillus jeddahense]UUI02853.1 hypothetical protein NP439_22935 [Oceanobacillus jeddahense]
MKSTSENKFRENNTRSSVIYFIITGFITTILSFFFMGRAIAEGDNDYFGLNFFLLIAVWGLGAILYYLFKIKRVGVLIAILPIVFYICRFILSFFM